MAEGHGVPLHVRDGAKFERATMQVSGLCDVAKADLSEMSNADASAHDKLAIIIVGVSPTPLRASKMVKPAFGIAGHDRNARAGLPCRAAVSDACTNAQGPCVDNDIGGFSQRDAATLDKSHTSDVTSAPRDVAGSEIAKGDGAI